MTPPPRRTSKPRAIATACALAVFASVGTAAAQPEILQPNADTLFAEGNKAYDASDWALAVQKYNDAFRLKPTFDIAANLGAAELKLAKFADAANHLAYAVRNYPPTGDAKKKAGAERLYGEARQKVGGLLIEAPKDATVRVDGKIAGTAPLADPFYVDPGEHTIEVESSGKKGSAKGRVQASETTKVAVAYDEGGTEPPPVTPPPGGTDAQGTTPIWPGLVVTGVGVVGIGVGVGLFLAGAGAASEADDIAQEIDDGGSSCNPPKGPLGSRCAEGEDKQSTANTLRVAGGLTMGIGGAVAVGGAIYTYWAATSGEPDKTGARFVPLVSPQTLGGAVGGRF